MRNKVNRLEEIFMRLVEGHGVPAPGASGEGGAQSAYAPRSPAGVSQ
jgi:hypothetical protein